MLFQRIQSSVLLDLPKLVDESCSDNDSDEENWNEIDEEALPTRSLFDNVEFATIEDAIDDMKTRYKFDLTEMKQKHAMDFYSYMKAITIDLSKILV